MAPFTSLVFATLAACASAASLPKSFASFTANQLSSMCAPTLSGPCGPTLFQSLQRGTSTLSPADLLQLQVKLTTCQTSLSTCSAIVDSISVPKATLLRTTRNIFDDMGDVSSSAGSDATSDTADVSTPRRIHARRGSSARVGSGHVHTRRNIFDTIGGAFKSAAGSVKDFATDKFGPDVEKDARIAWNAAKTGRDFVGAALDQEAPGLTETAPLVAEQLPEPIAAAAEDGALEIAVVG